MYICMFLKWNFKCFLRNKCWTFQLIDSLVNFWFFSWSNKTWFVFASPSLHSSFLAILRPMTKSVLLTLLFIPFYLHENITIFFQLWKNFMIIFLLFTFWFYVAYFDPRFGVIKLEWRIIVYREILSSFTLWYFSSCLLIAMNIIMTSSRFTLNNITISHTHAYM